MWAHKYDDFDLRCKDGAPQMLQSYSKKYQKITQLMRYGMQFRQWWQCRQLDNNCDNNRDSNLDNNLDNNLVDNIGDDWSKNIPPVYLKWSSTKRASTFIAISLPFSNIGCHCNCLWCDPPYSTPQPLTARKPPCLPLLGFLNSFIGVLVQPMVSLGTIQRTHISKHMV